MPDQNTFHERLKRLETKDPVMQQVPAASAPGPVGKSSNEFNYMKAIAAFGAVFVIGMVGLAVYTIQLTSG